MNIDNCNHINAEKDQDTIAKSKNSRPKNKMCH